jgi:hypothetical protein
MSNIEIKWDKPYSPTWRNGLSLEQVRGAIFDHVEVDAAPGSNSQRILSRDIGNIVWPR